MYKKTVVKASSGLSLAAVSVAIAVAVGAASASGAPAQRGALPYASGHLQSVVVMLRDKPSALAGSSLGRTGIVRAEERPLSDALATHGAEPFASGHALPFIAVRASAAQVQALKADPSVRAVFPDSTITGPSPARPTGPFAATAGKQAASTVGCGTSKSAPENDPEAIGAINSVKANALGYDGAGVKVAYIAGPIDTTIRDFKRNAKYASPGSPTGSKVVRSLNFTGDQNWTPSPDAAGESFLDASSIAAQGNEVYDLNEFVNVSHKTAKPCYITVTGAAPGAEVIGLSAFSSKNQTTVSNFIQAIDWAVGHGVKVLNESFTANNFPDTALDATRIVDDEAVAHGVTVVVSTGDGGITSTMGSPATDPRMIAAGATTTFRAYEQDTFGGVNADTPAAGTGAWLNDNISSISSAGFAQNGKTVDLVAPGDLNWALCSTNVKRYGGCTDENGAPAGIQLSGGTSESAPLISGAAADVIQAYASTHHGASPSPGLVKSILMSTARDISAPAEQQGAGLLNVYAAVKEAASLHGTTQRPAGSLLLSPNQINVSQPTGASISRRVTITNTSSRTEKVHLSTRTLTTLASHQASAFCLNPSTKAIWCGGPTSATFAIWSGVTEVYQEEFFSVPKTKGKQSRLNFSADYPYTGQNSLLHVALFDSSGAYAGYSDPQGLGNYANVQVANPRPGTWMALFFTEQDGATPGGLGTRGSIQWQADTWTYGKGDSIAPSTLTVAPGKRAHATLTMTSSSTPGDVAESVVVKSHGTTRTIPVTVRTRIRISPQGGDFSGVVTGGNGRDNPAQSNTYVFKVPAGKRDLEVSASLADPNVGVVAFLQNPEGQVVAQSSNTTFDPTFTAINGTGDVHVFKDNPEPGLWKIVLDWLQPVSGAELSEPFLGAVRFNQVSASTDLPTKGTLSKGTAHTFHVTIKNTTGSPQLFFLDPRANRSETIHLADQNGNDNSITLPIGAGKFPYYIVPTRTSRLITSLTGSGPVAYDIGPFAGDPDLATSVQADGVEQSQSGNSASLTFTPQGSEVETGPWYLNPSEVGPYPGSGAPPVTASASFQATLQAFDPSVATATGDLWSALNGLSNVLNPVYLLPGQSIKIPLRITPSAASGKKVSGVVNVDDIFQANYVAGLAVASGDELASFPFSYTVK